MRRGEFFQVRFWQHFESSLNVAMPLLLVAALVLVAVFLLQTLGWVGALAVAVVAAPFEYAGVRALLDLRRRNRRPGGRS